jgi:glycosyltransferase involved in cell wall biosynthesis
MPQIVFLCPPTGFITGGIKYLFRMAETLRELGVDAIICENHGQRPLWFASTAPIIKPSDLRPDASQFFVIPEDRLHLLRNRWPQKPVIYVQNHFYSGAQLGDGMTYKDYGVTDVIAASRTIEAYIRHRHPDVTSRLIPYGIDTGRFKPAQNKRDVIVYLPRKRAVEAKYLRDSFRYAFPELRGWDWQALDNASETEVATAMGEARVFLSLGRLESLGLTPLEAMASGCVVAGFTGVGGREYASSANGFWADEDDFPGCIAQLRSAIALTGSISPARVAYHEACWATLANYSQAASVDATKRVWEAILKR